MTFSSTKPTSNVLFFPVQKRFLATTVTRIEERKELTALIDASSRGDCNAFELEYHAKSREVKRSVCRHKREFK